MTSNAASSALSAAIMRNAFFVLLAMVGLLAFNIVGRLFGIGAVGANLWAAWLLPVLAWLGFAAMVAGRDAPIPQKIASALVCGFAAMTLALGMAEAAARVGGVEPVIAIPVPLRYALGCGFFGIGLLVLLAKGWLSAVFALIGAGLAVAPVPPLSPLWGVGVFAAALALRVPVPVALVAAVAVAPGPLSDAALAQTIMRGLSSNVLLAVPLFILAAALVVAGGIGERIVAAAKVFVGRRATALGETNIWASLLFGGVSASSIADAATGARLLAPPMIAAGYSPGRAAAICAASAVVPNVMPPSIALLLAAAATDQSVGALWTYGALAALVLTLALVLAVRLTPPNTALGADDPPATTPADGAVPPARLAVRGLLPVAVIALGLLGALRGGLVTAVEAGVVAVLLAAVFAFRRAGVTETVTTAADAAIQSGKVLILIAAAAPVGFLVAVSGLSASDFLPSEGALVMMAAAILVCLVVGTVLDAGAAILLVLPVVVPAMVAVGIDGLHATLTLTIALLIGGLTPPIGILVLVTKEVTGATGVYRSVLPYIAALMVGLAAVALVPVILGWASL